MQTILSNLQPASPAPGAAAPARPQDAALVARALWLRALNTAVGSMAGGEVFSMPGASDALPGAGRLGGGLLAQLLAQQQQAAPAAPAGPVALGSNEDYRPDIEDAAARSGMPPQAIAAIIDAEADKVNGVWDPNSANPRSSALGLSQFLSGTWLDEAKRPGTYLNDFARENGWLTENGAVRADCKDACLALRRQPRFAIMAAADYAGANLAQLSSQGLVPATAGENDVAKIAYLAHQMGPEGAAQFLRGSYGENEARTNLVAQLGGEAAQARAAQAGGFAAAHRQWLNHYIDSKIDFSQFAHAAETASARPARSMTALITDLLG